MDWLKGKPTRKKPMIWPPIYEGFLQIFPSTILGFSVWQLSFVDRASSVASDKTLPCQDGGAPLVDQLAFRLSIDIGHPLVIWGTAGSYDMWFTAWWFPASTFSFACSILFRMMIQIDYFF